MLDVPNDWASLGWSTVIWKTRRRRREPILKNYFRFVPPPWNGASAVDRWVKIAEVIVNFVDLTPPCGTEHNYADFAQLETELDLNRLDFGDCN